MTKRVGPKTPKLSNEIKAKISEALKTLHKEGTKNKISVALKKISSKVKLQDLLELEGFIERLYRW